MSSVQFLRDFISQRLTAAAAEIFAELEKTIEEEMSRHRRLLEISWKPQINTKTTDVPQQSVWKEEEAVLADPHLCYEDKNSSRDQNQPEPPQIKEEQEELCSSHQEEQRVLDQHTQTTSRCEEKLEVTPRDFNQNQEEISVRHRLLGINLNPEIRLHRIELPQQHVSSLDQEEPELPQMKEKQEELCSSQQGEQLVLKQETDTFMMTPTDQEPDLSETEPNTEQLYSHDSPLTGRANEEQSKKLDSGSTTDIELNPKKNHSNRNCQSFFCDSSQDHSYVLQTELDTQSGEKAFKCDFCGRVFRNKSYMLYHYKIHTGEKMYECKTCDKAFAQKGDLLKHTRIHTGEKPFTCKTCGKAFAQKVTLLVHARTHTGEKPFECKTCGKAFTHKCSLMKHTRIHSGENPYECKTCGKTFAYSCSLLVHTRIHTGEKPFQCKTCEKTFAHNSSLVKHTRIHTGEKPFKCKTCGKAFTQSVTLLVHTRIHTGEKPYECKTCGKAFLQKATLLQHSKTHTRGHVLVENTL